MASLIGKKLCQQQQQRRSKETVSINAHTPAVFYDLPSRPCLTIAPYHSSINTMCRRYHAMITLHATLSFFVSNDECTQPTTPLERPFKKVPAFYDISIEITLHRYSKTLLGQAMY